MIRRGLLRLVLALVGLAAAYACWAHWAWRDIAPAVLEERYGGAALRGATVEGITLRYRLEGKPGAPALVLIHSHYLDMGMWDGWMPALTAQFSVLRYDLSGHGLTGPDPSGAYTVARDVQLLEGLLAQLHLDPVVLAGSSLGGNIAFTYAATHPAQVRALALINSGGLPRERTRSGRSLPAWGGALMPLVPPSALHRFLNWMAADKSVVTEPLKQRFVDLWRREGNRQAEFQRLKQYETGDPTPLLAAITAPVLVQWGEQNPQLPVALASVFENKLTHARRVQVKTYAGAGHLLPLERPRESVNDLLAFVRTP